MMLFVFYALHSWWIISFTFYSCSTILSLFNTGNFLFWKSYSSDIYLTPLTSTSNMFTEFTQELCLNYVTLSELAYRYQIINDSKSIHFWGVECRGHLYRSIHLISHWDCVATLIALCNLGRATHLVSATTTNPRFRQAKAETQECIRYILSQVASHLRQCDVNTNQQILCTSYPSPLLPRLLYLF